MSELYWLTIFDGLNKLGLIMLFISLAFFCTMAIFFFASREENDDDGITLAKKGMKVSSPIFIIGLLMVIFIPTTEQALLIYGIGGTIDYLKSNDTAKQLPDKYIKALDKWVDEYTMDEKQNKEK